MKSAIEVLLLSRTKRTSFIKSPMPKMYSKIVPTKVGGSGQPERAACVTVPKNVHEVQYTASDSVYTSGHAPRERLRSALAVDRDGEHQAEPNQRSSDHAAGGQHGLDLLCTILIARYSRLDIHRSIFAARIDTTRSSRP